MAGWWLDGGEGPPARARLDGGAGTLLHNVYDRFRHQAFADGEAADRPDQRVFLLCRSGAAGMQRFGAACWSGDINNDFATLEAQIPLGLNTGLSGVPYWGSDVGGFFHAVPETGELYARWFQLGAFSPVFRSHGWVWREHVPWAHGPEVEAICRRYAELRYRLLPYTYTLAWQAHTLGLPLMRPLVLNYPDDPRVWQLASEFLWGDDLLVAPVTREGATAWPVYLPAGGWFDFWTGARFEGPVGITVEAPLDRLPLFVRAGAIVPMGPVIQHTGERQEEITLLIHPEGTSRFELYEDDGRSRAYRQGHHGLTTFECVTGPAGATVHIGEPAGDRSVVPAGRRYLLRLQIDRPTAVIVEGHGPLPQMAGPDADGPGWWVDGQGFARIRLPTSPWRQSPCGLRPESLETGTGTGASCMATQIDPVPSARLTRRSTHRRVLAPNTHPLGGAGMARRAFRLRLLTAFTIAVFLMIAAGPADAQKKGGMLRVGNLGEPPALDAHWTTASITETLTNHIYEGLYSLDREKKPIPMLRGEPHVSKDGLTYTFKLRQGVKFHNGKEMTSDGRGGLAQSLGQAVQLRQDPVRPGRRAPGGGQVHRGDEAQGEVGDRADLARGPEQLRGHLSEGDRREVRARGEGDRVRRAPGPTSSRSGSPTSTSAWCASTTTSRANEKPNGYGGGKTAYVDEIRWVPVPEVATRVAQVETGELDFADDLNLDAYDRLKANAERPPHRRPSRTTGSSRSSTRRKA